jgi:hypothetical protein
VFVPPPGKDKENSEAASGDKGDDVWASAWVSDGDEDQDKDEKLPAKPQSKLVSSSLFDTPRGRLAQLLTVFDGDTATSTEVLEYLSSLPPSKVDIEVRRCCVRVVGRCFTWHVLSCLQIRSLHTGVIDTADRARILKSALQFYKHEVNGCCGFFVCASSLFLCQRIVSPPTLAV